MSEKNFDNMSDQEKRIQWCIRQHENTNHFYDKYLPYEFHLRMVVRVCKDFIYLPERAWTDLEISCWGHDLIEDARVSYNDCAVALGQYAADIIYAVTNDKGKNRKERAGDKYYEGIRNTEGAVFVKLCDRIANVQYSKLTKSRMFEMYRDENDDFIKGLYSNDRYEPMFKYLQSLFRNEPEAQASVARNDEESTKADHQNTHGTETMQPK